MKGDVGIKAAWARIIYSRFVLSVVTENEEVVKNIEEVNMCRIQLWSTDYEEY